MKRCLLLILFTLSIGLLQAQVATNGDYRSAAVTGNWGGTTTWEVRAGGTWSTTTVPPTSTNNVYIQNGHTITVDVAAVCQDLHINVTGGVLTIGNNSVTVSGKLRSYTGLVTTGAIDNTFYTSQASSTTTTVTNITSGTGYLRFIGTTRTIIASTDWNGTTSGVAVEFALTAGQTGTLGTSFKAKSFLFTSGTIVTTGRIAPDAGASNTGTLTIKSGATLSSNQSGTATGNQVISRTGTTKCAAVTVDLGGTLELTGVDPRMDANPITFNGNVVYNKSAAQNLLDKSGNDASSPFVDTYYNLIIKTSNTKTIPAGIALSIKANGTLELAGTSSVSPCILGNGGSSSVVYSSTNTTLLLSGSANITLTATSLEWPAASGPINVSVTSNTLAFTPNLAAFTVLSYSLSGTTATINTTASHGFIAGSVVTITNVFPCDTLFNGTYTLLSGSGTTMTYTVSNPYSVSIAPSEIATAPFGAVTNAPLTRTIPGTLWLNGGSFNIGSGNKLIMANSSVIRRSSTSGSSQFTVNSGFYSVGVIATDLVNILIDANGTVIGSSEMRSSPAPGGFGNLTISPSTAKYNTSGARTVVNLINDGNLILAPTTTSTFTVTGNFTGTGTITSGNSNASITVGSASSTGDAGTIYFDQTTNGITNAFNNFKIDRTLPGAAGSVTIANSVSFKGNFQQSNGIVNLAPGTTFTLLGTTSNSNGSLRGNNTANISIGGTGALGNLYFDQTTPGTTNLFNNFTLNRTASGSATIGSDIIIGGTTTLTNGSLNIASSKTLTIGGNFTNNSGTGTLGGAADDAIINTPNLTITGSGATFNPLKFTPGFTEFRNLIFDRSATIDATAGNGLRIQGTLNLNNASTTLTTSDNVTLRSTSAGSARLLNLSAITTPFAGSFTAERYIPANANRAWRLLSVPTGTTQTINASWQNGQTPGVQGAVGKGTWVTSFLSTALANNYDAQSPNNYSLKTYNSSTGAWDGVSSSTTTTNIATDGGYMLFVRGDRTATNFGSTITATTLSTKGPLKYGNYPVTPITINANKFEIIGNPYPSAIDLRAVTRAGGTDAVFYVWDPKILPMGAFQTLTFNGTNYIITPGGGNYLPGGTTMDTIQSGQAFMAHATGANGTIQFTEACKSGGTRSVFRPTAPSSNSEGNLITNLYTIRNGSKDLSDGTLTIFGNTFSNNVNGSDAKKLANFNVNLGMKRDDQILAVEKREDIGITDTIFYNLTKPVISNYKLEIVATNLNHPNLTAKLVDAYLNRSTPVNLNATTTYDFNVINDAGSYAANRFMLVMYQSGAVPINQLTLQATKQNKQVALEWKAANQINIEQYEIETSGDSINFTKFAAMPSTGGNGETVDYNLLHEQAVKGNNYYRIKSIGNNGTIAYSNIVKVKMGDDKQPITVFPNLVTNSTIKLQFTDLAKGTYSLVLVNNAGQVMFTSQLIHAGGSAVYPVEISKSMGSGKYNLQVFNTGKTKIIIPIIIAN